MSLRLSLSALRYESAMRMCYGILACAMGVGILTPADALAQEHRDADRPSIGIALSGGAALGLAHIGVLRYFEEHHIPIDKVGGTSMGGLVGGLYAVGMDSSQIEALAREADWNALLKPSPPFADQPIVDKQKWNRTFGSLTLRFGKRFALPPGLNPGESLSLFLSRSTLGYSDFDQLPTPFRCVATDLVSRDSVVLSKGSLPVYGFNGHQSHLTGAVTVHDLDPTKPMGSLKTAWTACRKAAGCGAGCTTSAHVYIGPWRGQRSDSTIKALAGWKSAKMLERYSHTHNKAKRDAVSKLPTRRPK